MYMAMVAATALSSKITACSEKKKMLKSSYSHPWFSVVL